MPNEYVVLEIKLPNGGKDVSPVSKANASGSDSSNSEQKSWAAKNAESAQAELKKLVSVGTAMTVADRLISYEVGTTELRTGAREYEQKLQFGYSLAKQTAVPLVMGAISGGLAGAAIGIVIGFGMQAISWAQNAQTIRYNRDLENISIGMARVRAGVSGSRSDKQ